MTIITTDIRRSHAVSLLRDGAVSFAALLVSFAAFDDIPTGLEANLSLVFGAWLATAVCLFFVTFRLIRASRHVLGAMSLVALAGALWGQGGIGPGITPGPWPAYIVTASAFVWFTAVASVLLISGWRAHPDRHPHRV
jgi:hypothetical protein